MHASLKTTCLSLSSKNYGTKCTIYVPCRHRHHLYWQVTRQQLQHSLVVLWQPPAPAASPPRQSLSPSLHRGSLHTSSQHYTIGVCGWQKITSVQFSVRFCKKKLRLSVRFRFYKINRGFGFSVRLGLHSSVEVYDIFHLRLYGMTLAMTYFCAELVRVIASRSDSELEVQRYGMKKNTLTVETFMLQDEL